MVDFMAIARGQRLAEQDNRADERLLREREEYEFGRAGREQQWQENQWQRQAAAYLSPLVGNQQRAADAGIGAAEYIIQQRQQILADPNFQAMAPQVQSQVIDRLRESALLTAQQAQGQGDTATANQLVQEFGNLPVASGYDQALLTGDVQQIVEAANAQFGSNAVYNQDGTVTVGGMTMPGYEYARQIAQAGSPLGGLTALSQQAERDREQAVQDNAMRIAGYTQNAQGQWVWGAGPSDVPAPTAIGSDVTRSAPPAVTGADGSSVTQPTTVVDPNTGVRRTILPDYDESAPAPSTQEVANRAAQQATAAEDARMRNPAEWASSAQRMAAVAAAATNPAAVLTAGATARAPSLAGLAGNVEIGNRGPGGRVLDPATDPYLQQQVGVPGAAGPAAALAALATNPAMALSSIAPQLGTPQWLDNYISQIENDPGSGLGSTLRQLRGTPPPQQSGVERVADEVTRLRNTLARNLMEQSRPGTSARRRQQLVREAREIREQIQEQQ